MIAGTFLKEDFEPSLEVCTEGTVGYSGIDRYQLSEYTQDIYCMY